jgi:hypothetical protein
MAAHAHDSNEPHRLATSLQRGELLTSLKQKYGIDQANTETLGRTGLLRIIDTFDFLSNNLPANSRFK